MSDEVKRPPQYHIDDPVLPWVCNGPDAYAYMDNIEEQRCIYADAAFRWWYQARQNNYAAWAHLRSFERALQEAEDLTRERDTWKQAYADLSQRHDTALRERDEWKTRCMTSEASEEDAQQAAAQFKAERDDLRRENARLRDIARTYVGSLDHEPDMGRPGHPRHWCERCRLEADLAEAKTETCRWRHIPEYGRDDYTTACEHRVIGSGPRLHDGYKFCPYCGKQIEIVSEEVEDDRD